MVMPKKEPKKLRLTISSESEFKGKVLLTYHRHVVEMNVIPLKGSECAFSFGRFRNFLEPVCISFVRVVILWIDLRIGGRQWKEWRCL